MSSFQVVNKSGGGDHDKSVNAIIKDYLESNWSLTGDLLATNKGRMMFSTGWYQKQPPFQVHVRHDVDMPSKFITLGSRPISKFDDRVQVHCFATAQTVNAEPDNLDKMNREVIRIINADATGLETSEGIYMMQASSPRVLPTDDSQATIFHSIIRIELYYMKRYL